MRAMGIDRYSMISHWLWYLSNCWTVYSSIG
jgi:hypothetical protein